MGESVGESMGDQSIPVEPALGRVRHLAEGKLVPGANLEVILADPGPVGLTFYADDTAPPRVRKVKKDRRAFWEKHGMQDGAAILAVGDTPTAHLTSADLLPLLNSRRPDGSTQTVKRNTFDSFDRLGPFFSSSPAHGRPLRLQFALSGPPDDGLNALDDSGQTALHRALEEGDEAKALEILANPEFQSINVQEQWGHLQFADAGEVALCQSDGFSCHSYCRVGQFGQNGSSLGSQWWYGECVQSHSEQLGHCNSDWCPAGHEGRI